MWILIELGAILAVLIGVGTYNYRKGNGFFY